MKKRPLPLGYFILTIGVTALLLSATFTENDKAVAKNETAAEHLNSIRNNQVTGQLNPADYLKAMRQVEQSKMNRSAGEFNFNWELMGPNNLGGRVRAIVFDNQ
jgi:hypothetical protein